MSTGQIGCFVLAFIGIVFAASCVAFTFAWHIALWTGGPAPSVLTRGDATCNRTETRELGSFAWPTESFVVTRCIDWSDR